MSKPPTNVSASVHARLLKIAKAAREDFNVTLSRFVVERLLYRLVHAGLGPQFVLKGAMLFALWTDRPHRPTHDLDLLGYGEDSAARVARLFRQVCETKVEPDGLVFEPDSIDVADIREGQEYQGKRVRLTARLGKAQVRVQIDIGFGDAVAPKPVEEDYPTLLDHPAPRIRVYPKEAVLAEKLQAMVALGMDNSRMKDFFDVLILSRSFPFEGKTLCAAIQTTFKRRRTPLPAQSPLVFTPEFYEDRTKQTQWGAFLKKNRLEDVSQNFGEATADIRRFLGY